MLEKKRKSVKRQEKCFIFNSNNCMCSVEKDFKDYQKNINNDSNE
jgi:hypothetical protein